jgi:hypothetical protein
MLSDTLHDACAEIEQYEREYPDNYEPMTRAIAKIKTIMRALQMAMDLCPVGESRAKAWRIVGMIEALDTTALEGLTK